MHETLRERRSPGAVRKRARHGGSTGNASDVTRWLHWFFCYILKTEYDNFFEIIVIFFLLYQILGDAREIVIFAKYDKKKNWLAGIALSAETLLVEAQVCGAQKHKAL